MQEEMISEKENTRISKMLSLVLRHQPEKIGIHLDEQGWTDVEELINKLNENGLQIDLETLRHVVDTNQKKRFAFNDTSDKIRANQGHSVEVELGYTPQTPPDVLYHGTTGKYVEGIMTAGLQKMQRHHVHLSADTDTAAKVGQRHGKPVILTINAREMHNNGHEFFISDNGVWLTDFVAPEYITIPDAGK